MFVRLVSLLVSIVGMTIVLEAHLPQSTDDDDRAVFAAILEQSVRPFVAAENGSVRPLPPLFVYKRSAALCNERPQFEYLCIPLSDIEFLAEGFGRVFSRYDDSGLEAAGLELIEAFKKRNQSSYALPRLKESGVVMASTYDIADSYNSGHSPARGLSHFSRPAYSPRGYALVHGVYTCGGPTCGHASLYLLRRTPAGWQVLAVAGLWIS